MITIRIYKNIAAEIIDEIQKYLDYFACDIEFIREQGMSEKSNKLTIHDIDSLSASLLKIYDFVVFLEQNDFEIEVLDNPFNLQSSDFISALKKFGTREKSIFKKQVAEGLERARDEGKSLGRPRISDEKIKQIRSLYKKKKTLREIATKCDVSLGTAHKYTNE